MLPASRHREFKLFQKENEMKRYESPNLLVVKLDESDIITASPGTETTPKDESDGIWDLNL